MDDKANDMSKLIEHIDALIDAVEKAEVDWSKLIDQLMEA